MIAFGIFLLKASICLTVFYILYVAFFKNNTFFHFNRCYLLFALVASFLIPVLQLPLFENQVDLGFTPTFSSSPGELNFTSPVSQNGTVTTRAFPYALLLAGLYLAGVVVQLARFIFFSIRILRLKNSGESYYLGNVKIVKTKLDHPFTFFHLIFVPDYSLHPLILSHEMTHIKQFHWIDLIVVEVASMLLWFNPILPVYQRLIKLQHEYLADSQTLAQGIQPEMYLDCLLTQIHLENSRGPISPFYSNSVKNRITMITKNKTRLTSAAVYLLLLPVICLLLFAFSGKSVSKPSKVAAQTNDQDGKPSIFPVDMTRSKISSPFGERIHPYTNKKQMHTGIDLILPEGELVMATADGVVTSSLDDLDRGNYIIIKHDATYSTSYSHLRNSIVKAGEKVEKGQTIGYVGSTGRMSTSAHLHYEVLLNGKAVDPKDYLPQ